MQRNRLILLAYIVSLQILDVITTYLALRSGAIELNPLVRMLGNDPVKLLIFKGMIGFLVYLLITDKNVMKYQKLVLLLIYTIIMVQAAITNIINMVI
ncbi:MAG: hypothetical protein GXO43_01295 [Crenarchaeota archaeon]|nr:hypothetical protein [Thermoproteota archaeon]